MSTKNGATVLAAVVPPKVEFGRLVRFGAEERPAFPTALLPASLAAWVEEQARALQVPPDLPAVLALGACSAAVGGRYSVSPWSGWAESLNAYFLIILPPGEKKSAAFSPAVAPLLAFQHERQKEESSERRREADAYKTAEGRVERAREALEKNNDPDATPDLEAGYEAALEELTRTPRPRAPLQLAADDITPEAATHALEAQGGRLAVMSAEGGLLGALLGRRYSRSGDGNLDLFLKGHSGDPLAVNRSSDRERRAGRPLFVPRPALTLVLAAQPAVLRDLGSDAENRGRGALARFMYSIPRSAVGTRTFRSAGVDPLAHALYTSVVTRLLALPDDRDENGMFVPRRLALSPAAADVLAEFGEALEPRMGPDGDLCGISDWALKAAGAAVRIAGVLHLVDAVARHEDPAETVAAEHVVAGVEIVKTYFLPHALAAFGTMNDSTATGLAKRVAAWIVRRRIESFAPRDVLADLAKPGSEIEGVDDLAEPLRVLADRGYIVEDGTPYSGRGRPAGPRFVVNPAVHGSPETSSKSSGSPAASGSPESSSNSSGSPVVLDSLEVPGEVERAPRPAPTSPSTSPSPPAADLDPDLLEVFGGAA